MSTATLSQKECLPCKGGTPPLAGEELYKLYAELGADWQLVNDHHLEKEYKFKGYAPAVAFTNVVASLAEEQNHHPDLLLAYGKVKVSVWTHKIDGLTESDFVFAAKIEELFGKSK